MMDDETVALRAALGPAWTRASADERVSMLELLTEGYCDDTTKFLSAPNYDLDAINAQVAALSAVVEILLQMRVAEAKDLR